MSAAGRWAVRGLIAFGRLSAVAAALLIAYLLWRIGDTGGFSPYGPERTGDCRSLPAGPLQDLTQSLAGVLYLALGDGGAERPAGLYILDLAQAEPQLRNVTPPGLAGFAPVGLGLYEGPEGAMLFAVNRHPGGERVESFDITPAGLVHRETFGDPAFVALQDVAPTAPRHFYVSQSAGTHHRVLRILETLLGLPVGRVLYFDGTLADPVRGGLSTPRGLVLEGRELYAAELLNHRVSVFERNESTGALTPERTIPLPAMPQQINRAQDGSLYAAAQPRLFRYVLERRLEHARAPSQVLKIDGAQVDAVFVDDGRLLSAAHAALRIGDVLVLGSERGGKLLICHPAR